MSVRPGEREEPTTALHHRFQPTAPPGGVFTISVLEGASAGQKIELDGSSPSRVLVGQSAACDLQLSDRSVSRRHAAFDVEGSSVRVTDLGSRNGTFVGRLRVESALLEGGETVRLGATVLAVDYRKDRPVPALTTDTSFGRTFGASREMRRIYPLCERLAGSSVGLIIEGETGTGKEVLAESIHDRGARAASPFVVFDCTSVPESLIEAELLGHERGAFTGAAAVRRGVFEQAHGGTLLIDEIGDLPLSLQPKLLRVLERSEFRRVGGERAIQVDVRVIAATRRNLDREVEAGRFRDDLFHRLFVARIELPPLRRRHGDIALLANLFHAEMGGGNAGLPNAVLSRFEGYEWPGNVRELRNAVARYLVLGDTDDAAPRGANAPPLASSVTPEHVDVIEEVLALRLPLMEARQRVVEAFEQRYIERTLAEHGGVVTRAAESSGIARRHFHRLRAKTGK
jgi:two-component system, NtrC family, response regulator HydG